MDDPFASAPTVLRASTRNAEVRYRRAPELVAVHGLSVAPPDATRLDETTFVVAADTVAGGRPSPPAAHGPVYRREDGGGLVAPTGSVLVRFPEGDPVERHGHALEEVGYELAEVLAYAPHAGWVRAADGTIVGALVGLERLESLPGIENVEPQMLSERRARPGPP